MNFNASKVLRTMIVFAALNCGSAYSSATRPAGAPNALAVKAAPGGENNSPGTMLLNAAGSLPEAGFMVLLGSALVAISAKARRGRQPS